MTFEEKIRIGAAVADATERAQEEQLKKIEEFGNALSLPKRLQIKYDYSYVSDFEYGLARVRKGKIWGLINEEGKVVLPIQYDEIWKFEGKHRATTNVVYQGETFEIRLCDYSDKAPIPYLENSQCESSYEDDFDYRKESWYAMTDGQYGDMPDGFDGDYDWLGY